MSQAYIGYQLQESLLNELHALNIDKQVVTLVTQVEVAGDDQAFNNPTKPIGLFYTKEQAEQTMEEKGYKFVEDSGRGYRRVVPSPMPINIVELDSIETLIKHGTLVIAVVVAVSQLSKKKVTIKASIFVIDKDKTSALLATLKIRSINHLNNSRLCLY